MRIRNFLLAAAFVAASVAPAVAQMSAANAAWPKGPEQFIMTNEEKAAWAKVSSDDAAAAFIKDFWARRDPAFHQEFDAKVKYADEHFKGSRQRGATTDRGKILILFGTPTRVTKEGGSQRQGGAFDDTTTTAGGTGFHENETARQTWIYEGDASQKVFGIPRTEITFTDQFGNGDFHVSNARVDVNATQQKVIAASLAHAPAAATQQPPAAVPQPAAVPAPALPADALKTQALRDAIAAQKAGSSTLKKGGLVYAEFVAPSGDFYVPVGIIVPKGDGVTGDAYDTVFGQVEDATGAVVASFEQATKPTVYKNGVFADRTLTLASGKYNAVVGLAKGGTPVVIGSKSFEVTSVAKDAPGTSKLFVTNDLVELGEPAPEKTGFAFGKTKVIPTVEFSKNDTLIFFVEVHNPGIDPTTNQPKLQASLDFWGGKFKKPISRPLTEQPVAPLSGRPGPGQYAVIDSIPLSEIKNVEPGDYTLKMKIVDTVTKQSYTIEQSFKIVG
jgi:GWxTD domain-containing protein